MRYRIVCVGAVFALAVVTASSQTKASFSGKCGKPDVQHSIPAGDYPGHALTLAQGKCSATGEMGGAAAKEGTFSENGDSAASRVRTWGVYVETFDSGDKVFYNYQTSGTVKDGAFQAGQNKYQVTGGTGKMKGIKGSGMCKLTGAADGSVDYSCEGQYTLAGAAMAKP